MSSSPGSGERHFRSSAGASSGIEQIDDDHSGPEPAPPSPRPRSNTSRPPVRPSQPSEKRSDDVHVAAANGPIDTDAFVDDDSSVRAVRHEGQRARAASSEAHARAPGYHARHGMREDPPDDEVVVTATLVKLGEDGRSQVSDISGSRTPHSSRPHPSETWQRDHEESIPSGGGSRNSPHPSYTSLPPGAPSQPGRRSHNPHHPSYISQNTGGEGSQMTGASTARDASAANTASRSRGPDNIEPIPELDRPPRFSIDSERFNRKWKLFAITAFLLLLALLAVILSITLSGALTGNSGTDSEGGNARQNDEEDAVEDPPIVLDTRPTLEIVQERGYVKCGLRGEQIEAGTGFNIDLCRAVAAVVLGDANKYEGVPLTFASRWKSLNNQVVDLLLLGDTHTIEREVKESSTGAGFSFSTPYNYDGMVYLGTKSYVDCAEAQKRYGDCLSLKICAGEASTHHSFLQKAFPSDYFKLGSTLDDIITMLFNQECNVLAFDKSAILSTASSEEAIGRGYVLGTQMKTKEPLAIVTRNSDRVFSDVVNWVLQALLFGEEQGLSRDPARCHNYSGSTELSLHSATDLNFMNAIYCVGNYGEIISSLPIDKRGMNEINDGSTGMLYAIPFGNLDTEESAEPSAANTMEKIRRKGKLNCGIVIPEWMDGRITVRSHHKSMGTLYCQTLAAALLNGNPKAVKFVMCDESELNSYISLANGEVDVLVGGAIQRRYDFERSASLGGFHFSTPYYYGDEGPGNEVDFYGIVTREDDVLFSSFVNCIVLGTIYAEENRLASVCGEPPLVSVFGSEYNWALRDAIAYSGSYDQIYTKTFSSGNSTESARGRNTLNIGGPMMHSLNGLP